MIYSPDTDIIISHSQSETEEEVPMEEEVKKVDEELEHADGKEEAKEKTFQDVLYTFNEEQKQVLYALVGAALEEGGSKEENSEGESKEMKHNVFENEINKSALYAARKDFEAAVIKDAKSFGSMKESFLAHAEEGLRLLVRSVGVIVPGEAHELSRILYLVSLLELYIKEADTHSTHHFCDVSPVRLLICLPCLHGLPELARAHQIEFFP